MKKLLKFLLPVFLICSSCDIPEAHQDPYTAITVTFGFYGGRELDLQAQDVAYCESRMNPSASNYSGQTPNLGLFQIDSIHQPEFDNYMASLGLPYRYWSDWDDPYANSVFALELYKSTNSWWHWTTGGGVCGR